MHALLRRRQEDRRRHPEAGDGVHRQAREVGRQEVRRPQEPAARLRPLWRARVDARHDGHDFEPRPQREGRRDPREADEEPALGVGLLPPLHPDVLRRRHGGRQEVLREADRRHEGEEARQERRRPHRSRPQDACHPVQGRVQGQDRQGLPDRREGAALRGDQGRVPQLGQPARERLPPRQRHPVFVGHGGQRPDDGVRQPERPVRHGRRLHARPRDGREEAHGRVPHERAGRGRRRRREDPDAHREDGRGHAQGVQAVPEDLRHARGALPRHAGHGVHDREPEALHAPDAQRQAHGQGRAQDRVRPRRRGHAQREGGGAHDRAPQPRHAPPPAVRRGRAQERQGRGPRPRRLPGRCVRQDRLHRGRRDGVEEERREDGARAPRDLP